MKAEKKNSNFLIYTILLFILCIIFRDVLGVSINSLLLIALLSASIIFLNYSDVYKLIFFLMPFACGIPGHIFLISYIILIAKSKKINIWQIVPAVIIVLLELFSLSFSDFNIIYTTVISYLSFIALFFYLLFDKDARINKAACIKYFCYGTAIVLIITYINVLLTQGFESLITGVARQTAIMGFDDIESANGHLRLNANSIAFYSITILTLLLSGKNQMSLKKYEFVLLICVALFAGIFSFSRTWLILAFCASICYIIKSQHRFFYIFVLLIFVAILLTTQNEIVTSISSVFKGRLENENFSSGGGRIPIFLDYLDVWLSKLRYIIFGTGASHYKNVCLIQFSSHCGLQQIWTFHGLVGILLFFSSAANYILNYRAKNLSFIAYIPLIFCFLFDQTIQFLVPYLLIFPIISTFYLLSCNRTI